MSHSTLSHSHLSGSSLKGILWILLWSLSMTVAMSFNKLLSPQTTTACAVFFKNVCGMVVFLPLFFRNAPHTFRMIHKKRHVANALLLPIAMGCTYYAYRYLPLSFATTIGFSGPLFTTTLSVLLLKEKVSVPQWAFILFGYAGVVVALQPISLTYHNAIFVEILANIFAGLVIINRKKLLETDSDMSILFYGLCGSIILTGIVSLFFWSVPTMMDWALLLCIGGAGSFSHYAYIQGLKLAQPGVLAPFEYSRLLLAIPIDLFFFGKDLYIWMFVGAGMIFLAGIGLIRQVRS